MMNFEKLGRSLSKSEQKHIFGGLNQQGIVCTCSSGGTVISSSICVGPADRCVGAAVRDCDGDRVRCGDPVASSPNVPDPLDRSQEPIILEP